MLKCPKCGFQQPEDIYCANCGVNMQTFKAEPKPIFKSLLTNWMVQLAALVIVIVSVVLYDRGSERKPRPSNVSQSVAANSEMRRRVTPPPPPPPTAKEKRRMKMAANSASEIGSAFKRVEDTAPAEAQTEVLTTELAAPAVDLPAGTAPTKSALQATYYQISKSLLADLQRDTQGLNISGDAVGGLISQKKLQALKSSGEMRRLSGHKYRGLHSGSKAPVMFTGHMGEGKNIGLSLQVTPVKQENSTSQIEVKCWGTFKMEERGENLFSSEMTLNAQYSAYIAGFMPKDKTFTDEEKALFESDRTLRLLIQEDFLNDSSDLILIIELAEAS